MRTITLPRTIADMDMEHQETDRTFYFKSGQWRGCNFTMKCGAKVRRSW